MNEFDVERMTVWGLAMHEVWQLGLSITIHHDNYPRWTCRLWRNVGKVHYDITATAYDPLDALKAALEKVNEQAKK